MSESVSYWPEYASKPRNRVIAVWDRDRLVTEHGDIHMPTSYTNFVDILFKNKLDLYCNSILSFQYIPEAVEAGDEVLATARREVCGLRIKRGRETRWVGEIKTWGRLVGTATALQDIRLLMQLCGVGTYISPSALGQAVWRSVWQGEQARRVSRPPGALRESLLSNLVGGRADLFVTGEHHEILYEIDLRSAYAAQCVALPVGTAVRIPASTSLDYCNTAYLTWYSRCEITIFATLVMGVFPLRQKDKTVYPVERGSYTVWLWKEEALEAEKAGCGISILQGWGWVKSDSTSALWAARMNALRDEAQNERVADMLKAAIVAAIGRHGMGPWRYTVIHERYATPDDLPMIWEHGLSIFWLRKTYDYDSSQLTHWYSYIMAKCRTTLYQRMMAEQAAGNQVIASNYDAIYLRRPTMLPTGGELGEWRERALHQAEIPYLRAIDSIEKRKMPGVMSI